MNEEVGEWVAKAEGDLHSAEREMRARKFPNYDSACFHAQQCAEKYLKGFMLQEQIAFRPIHDLVELLTAIVATFPDFQFIQEPLTLLNQYAVRFRYPRFNAERDEAREAVKAMRVVREFVRHRLGLR